MQLTQAKNFALDEEVLAVASELSKGIPQRILVFTFSIGWALIAYLCLSLLFEEGGK